MSGTDPRSERARSRDLGATALAGLALIWGYGWIVTKVGFAYIEPYTFAALRSVLSVLCLFVLLLLLRRPLRPVALGATLVIGLLQTSGFIALTMWALSHTGAGKTSVLTYTMPFWLLLMAWAFLGERLRRFQWPAVGLAFTGLVLVVSPWRLNEAPASLAAVAGGLCWAASAVAAKALHRRHDVDVLSLTAWQMLLGTPVLILIAVFAYSAQIDWGVAFAGVLAYNVLLANGLAWVLWLFALRALSTGGAGIGTLAVPVVGATAAWVHLGETPAPAEAVGMVLIIAALAILALGELAAGRRPAGAGSRQAGTPTPPTGEDRVSGTLAACSERSPSTSGTRSSSTSAAESASDAAPRSSPTSSAAPAQPPPSP
jgi:drug/metabolite transporter (DMT)-like permease